MHIASTSSSSPAHLPACLRASNPRGAVAHAQLQPEPWSCTDTPASSSAEMRPEIEPYRCAHVRRQLSSRHQQHASSLRAAAAAAAAAATARRPCGARDGSGFETRSVR